MSSPGRKSSAHGGDKKYDIYYGIVTQNKDEEKKLGRIKVRFPWIEGGEREQSWWAQVAVPMAGAKFGTFVLPDVGDTVMVVFRKGNFDHPVVIGGDWNKVEKPPETNASGTNDFRFIKSRVGHRLLFDDTAMVKIVLTDYTNTNYIGVGNYPEAGDAPNKFELQAPPAINGSPTKGVAVCSMQGTVNIRCPSGTLTITAKDVEITASQAIDIKAGASLTMKSKIMELGSAGGNNLQGGTTSFN